MTGNVRGLRIGVVGAGMIAAWHLQRWARLPVVIAGYHTRTASKALELAGAYGGRVFGAFDELLAEVDVVDVCTPTPHHRLFVEEAARQGKAVICEKPLARTLDDAMGMVETCAAAGVPLCVGHVVRFFPQYVAAKGLLERGSIGDAGVFRATRGSAFPRASPDTWYSDPDQTGGVIMDLAIHDLDVALWWLGPVDRVFARGLTYSGTSRRDHALMTLRFRSGAIGHVESSWSMPPGRFYNSFELAGSGGIVEWNGLDRGPLELHRGREETDDNVVPVGGMAIDDQDDPFYAELTNFLAHIERGAPLRVTAEEGVDALRLALAGIESLRTGVPVVLAAAAGDGASPDAEGGAAGGAGGGAAGGAGGGAGGKT